MMTLMPLISILIGPVFFFTTAEMELPDDHPDKDDPDAVMIINTYKFAIGKAIVILLGLMVSWIWFSTLSN